MDKELGNNAEELLNQLNSWGLSFNAHKKFNEIVDSILNSTSYYDSEIFELIDNIVMSSDSKFKSVVESGTKLYRAREISITDYANAKGLSVTKSDGKYLTSGYNNFNSIEPPVGIPYEGRNNIAGVSYLYLANDPVTACSEIKSSLRSLISLANFNVQCPLNIIDFSKDVAFDRKLSIQYNMSFGVFFSLLMLSFSEPNIKIYRFTQIISDYIRKFGVDGIAYKSFFTGKTNYTLFNTHKSKIIFECSRILSHQFTNEIFWDFNNNSTLSSLSDSKYEYDVKTADTILKKIENTFQ